MNRKAYIDHLNQFRSQWDIILIGGGASGLGTALDASSRGYRTLLLERGDFAQETSSRSTKLIHGGLRYLQQGNLSLVHSALKERERLLKNAPHLVHPQQFILPTYQKLKRFYYLAGIKLYDLLAGKRSLKGSRLLSKDEVLQYLPTINPEGLTGGISFYDGQFDDARLAINLAQSIAELGGIAINYMEVIKLLKMKNEVIGVVARDSETHQEFEIQGKVVINATGVFVDSIRKMDDETALTVLPSQGTHIVLDRKFLPNNNAIIIPETSKGSVLFAIPWHQHVLVGTTDTLLEKAFFEPIPKWFEIEYLLDSIGQYLIKKPLKSDILSTFAGIRPLIPSKEEKKNPSSLPRDYRITKSASRLITVVGGKWTTYRKISEDVVDTAIQMAGLPLRSCQTANLRLHGWSEQFLASEWGYYGSDLQSVEKLADIDPSFKEKLHPNLPCRPIDVIWAVRNEMAMHVEDVLSRRNRSLLLNAQACIEIAPSVAKLMAIELGYSKEWEMREIVNFQNLAQSYTNAFYK
jgi:glycerol-3-phosphate dehydrogenase